MCALCENKQLKKLVDQKEKIFFFLNLLPMYFSFWPKENFGFFI
jgi:hypothetical protein